MAISGNVALGLSPLLAAQAPAVAASVKVSRCDPSMAGPDSETNHDPCLGEFRTQDLTQNLWASPDTGSHCEAGRHHQDQGALT